VARAGKEIARVWGYPERLLPKSEVLLKQRKLLGGFFADCECKAGTLLTIAEANVVAIKLE
jgi:hypothetical protein